MQGETYLSFSSLTRFAHSPRAFVDYRLEKANKDRKVTDAMKIGLALHEQFLERKLFTIDVIPKDRPKRPSRRQIEAKNPSDATKISVEFWSRYDEKNSITHEQYEEVKQYAQLCEANVEAKFLRDEGEVEVREEIVYKGINFVRKMDIISHDYHFIADLKKCPNVSQRKFKYKVRDELLHVQAAIYLLGRDHYDYKWLAVDGKDCIVHNLGSSAFDKGMRLLNELLTKFKKMEYKDWLKGREFWEKNSIIDF